MMQNIKTIPFIANTSKFFCRFMEQAMNSHAILAGKGIRPNNNHWFFGILQNFRKARTRLDQFIQISGRCANMLIIKRRIDFFTNNSNWNIPLNKVTTNARIQHGRLMTQICTDNDNRIGFVNTRDTRIKSIPHFIGHIELGTINAAL